MYSVGSFFSTVTKFYNEINPATLSGAIDIVVVQQANGDLACSPFHVRFGKLSVLRPQEKVVEVKVNGEVIAYPMKVGDAGEAFFVLETDDYVPDEFATSPIAGPSDGNDLSTVDYFDLQAQNGALDEDPLLDNGYVSAASGHGSAFEESLKDDSDRESSFSGTSPPPGRIAPGPAHGMADPLQSQGPIHPLPDSSLNPPSEHSSNLQTIDPKNPGFPVNDIFPSVVRQDLTNKVTSADHDHDLLAEPDKQNSSGRRKSEVLFDMTGYKTDSCSESSDDDLPRGVLSDSERHHRGLRKKFGKAKSNLTKEQRQQLLEDIKQGAFLKPEENLANIQLERQASRELRRKKRAGIPNAWTGRKGRKRANSMPAIGEPDVPFSESFPRINAPNSSQGNIKTGIIAEAAPKRTNRPSVMSDTEMEYETNASPIAQSKEWTWGWGSLPVKPTNPDEDDDEEEHEMIQDQATVPEDPVEIVTKEFQMGSSKCNVALSLCGEEEFGRELVASHKAFLAAQLTFEAFSKDPAAVLADKRLVCYLDGRFYTWSNAVPQLTALLFFHQPLADSSVQHLKDQKDDSLLSLPTEDRPASTRFGSISRWWRKTPAPDATSASTAANATSTNDAMAVSSRSDDEDEPHLNKALRSKSLPPLDTGRAADHSHHHAVVPALSEKAANGIPDTKRYAKTLRLTSEQLRSLGLNKGANTVSFSVTSSYQGTATCVAKIFLWDHDSQVVISDIDGTITKSDALGHIFAMAGRDWTHLGVAKLFTDIRSNGYNMLYLTSRAVGQADYTRRYLKSVEQGGYQLPDGPVIMSPDRLFSAFHREVIIRKPEVFKMACLRDIKKLFGDRNPFYAGFGNRITDALSYRSVNVPPSRIFTIDSGGALKLELLSAYKSSYLALNDLVNEIFPEQRQAPEFNDWNFWKSELPKIELPDLPIPTNNYGLLSSTASVAKKVVSLTHSSSSSSLIQPTSPPIKAQDKRLSTSYAGALLGRQESWVSDEDQQDQSLQEEDSSLQRTASGNLKGDNRKARASSPSMLSALVPTRLIRAVRSGSTSSQVAPMVAHSPETKVMIGSLPDAFPADDNDIRPMSIPSPPPLEKLLQTDDDVVAASQGGVGQKTTLSTDQRMLLTHEYNDDQDEEDYQGDYEEGEDYMEGDEEDEDDEFLDDIEDNLEEPFL